MKSLSLVLIITGMVVAGFSLADLAFSAGAREAKPEKLEGVYLLNGHNVWSFLLDESGNSIPDGAHWDRIVLVDPMVDGDKIIIPNSPWYEGKEGRVHFFYRDQLWNTNDPVYGIQPGARSWSEEVGSKIWAPDSYDWEDLAKRTFLVGPEIDPNGSVRVYIGEEVLPVELLDKKSHFFYRGDLQLLNPEVLRWQ